MMFYLLRSHTAESLASWHGAVGLLLYFCAQKRRDRFAMKTIARVYR